jgi:hypothetical protein
MPQLYFSLGNPTVVRGLMRARRGPDGGIQAYGYQGSRLRNSHEWEWSE